MIRVSNSSNAQVNASSDTVIKGGERQSFEND
jgi:hypothetical protein